MSACEKCWTAANLRARLYGGFVADHYRDLLAENKNNPEHRDEDDE